MHPKPFVRCVLDGGVFTAGGRDLSEWQRRHHPPSVGCVHRYLPARAQGTVSVTVAQWHSGDNVGVVQSRSQSGNSYLRLRMAPSHAGVVRSAVAVMGFSGVGVKRSLEPCNKTLAYARR